MGRGGCWPLVVLRVSLMPTCSVYELNAVTYKLVGLRERGYSYRTCVARLRNYGRITGQSRMETLNHVKIPAILA